MSSTETNSPTRPDFVVTRIGLHELHIDPLNVRAVESLKEDPILTASIAAHGLQTPLIVRKNSKGWGVVAGGKRLVSLQKLYPDALACIVPCVVIDHKTADVAIIEASLAENVARSDMNPVDQYRAFAALANDKDNPQSVAQIAKRFGQTTRRVEQLLALGALEKSVLDAYAKEEFGADVVRAFTMIASHKTQKAVLAKIRAGEVHANAHNVRRAAGIENQNVGKFLALIGREAYEARGGKIIEDLFGNDHVLSDTALVMTMVNEAIAAKAEALKAEGWKEVVTEQPSDFWRYDRVSPKIEPTKAEQKELKRLAEIVAINEEADDYNEQRDKEADAASDAHDVLEAAIRARAITPQMKAKAIVYLSVDHKGSAFEIDCRYPPRASKTPAAKKAAEKSKLPVEEQISQALHFRLNETLTIGARRMMLQHKNVALAGLIAALSSRDTQTVGIRFDHHNPTDTKPFAASLASALKLSTAEQVDLIVRLISGSVRLYSHDGSAFDHDAHAALLAAIDGVKMTKAIREEFDMAGYFDSVPKTVIAEAVSEAMGKDHAVRIARMDKASAAKFATENLGKLKWLPVQLRVKGYDGPKAKAPAKKAAAKKAKR